MNLDFSFQDHMRLSSVKRWGIIEMSRAQNVAEHSYNVAAITLSLVDILSDQIEDSGLDLYPTKIMAMEWALLHDLTELVTGDLPTPVKTHLGKAVEHMEDECYPRYAQLRQSIKGTAVEGIVKAADLLDAIQFADRFCIDPKKSAILTEMRNKLEDLCLHYDAKWHLNLGGAVTKCLA